MGDPAQPKEERRKVLGRVRREGGDFWAQRERDTGWACEHLSHGNPKKRDAALSVSGEFNQRLQRVILSRDGPLDILYQLMEFSRAIRGWGEADG